ncbi:hypothetical protein [Streptomyces sp. NPDC026673]|uniref:hypothetical protein n=1 Tax=Streptomyces sp. NPDC026673 TaxID=3155724 RepID=UPI0033D2577C
MGMTRANGRHYGMYGLVVAAGVVVAVGLGVPIGAVFILAVALVGPLLMLVMLHALRGSEAHRHPVFGALHTTTAAGGAVRVRGSGSAVVPRGPGDPSGPREPGPG